MKEKKEDILILLKFVPFNYLISWVSLLSGIVLIIDDLSSNTNRDKAQLFFASFLLVTAGTLIGVLVDNKKDIDAGYVGYGYPRDLHL